jgi:hypothetical protein
MRFRSLGGHRSVFSAGPQGSKNVVGWRCALPVLLYIRTNEDRDRKVHYFVVPKSPSTNCVPPSRGALGHGLFRLYLNSPLVKFPNVKKIT